MPTRSEVWLVADKLRAKPARVSIRSVMNALPRGGSFRVIGKHLAEWKEERCYQPRLELAQLPEGLQTRLVDFGKAVWESTLREATRKFEHDRERFEGMRLHDQKLRDEALAAADASEARIEAFAQEAERLRFELATAREQIKGLRRKLKGVRAVGEAADILRAEARSKAREFWDKVVEEVRELLALPEVVGNGMTRDEILVRLSEPLKAEAVDLGEDLHPAKIAKRLDERVLRKKLDKKDGVYLLRAAG